MTDSPQTALTETTVRNPITGEILDLAATATTTLADHRYRLIELRRQIDAFASDLDQEIAHRADHEGTGTLHVGIFTLTVPKPTRTAWDVHELGLALEALVTDGRISRAKATRALETIITYKPKTTELNQLLAHADPEVARTIAVCRHTIDQNRRVAVTVQPGRHAAIEQEAQS